MSDTPFEGSVAIDTNVFLHLFDSRNNPGGHINRLLNHLVSQRIALIVDDKERIHGEYLQHVIPLVQKGKYIGNERSIMRFWFMVDPLPRHVVSLDTKESLMKAIRNIMPRDSRDRIFVYVAFKEGKILISNDEADIVDRRQRLLNDTRQIRRRIGSSDADILTSQEAHDRIG